MASRVRRFPLACLICIRRKAPEIGTLRRGREWLNRRRVHLVHLRCPINCRRSSALTKEVCALTAKSVWVRRVLGASVVGAMAAAGLAVFASPASASLIGVEVVSEFSEWSSDPKSVEAECPNGKVLVGTGAYVAYGREVRIKDITPFEDHVEVEAFEDDDGTLTDWYVRADAICAIRPLSYEIVQDQDPSNSRTRESAIAECTGDNVVLGTAAEIDNISTGDVMIDTVLPTRDSVLVAANEDKDGTGVNWEVSAWAICADPSAGPTILSVQSPSTSSGKSQSAVCGSRNVTGMGGVLSAPFGSLSLSSLKPSEYPLGNYIGFAQGAEVEGGTTDSWTVTTYLVCA
jgi:hypothetical protein